ncbi:MAG: tRNA preQ1(34) S-adenosylmethionine ribosyltransferase-isomerase QueA [Sandaracinaceae bacterium]|nr:tRNA preQ1(34) S-adenosylmethionine ribosyltransferase-isomerase QueA [Sandaracinaceae bacterium]
MRIEDLDYDLPEALIAQHPTAARDAARLLVPHLPEAQRHRGVAELPALLEPSLIVWNDARVIPARLRGSRESGGKAELLLLEPVQDVAGATPGQARREVWLALGKANKPLKPGHVLRFGDALRAEVLERLGEGQLQVALEPLQHASVIAALDAVGELPLPPYIERAPERADAERYQTVFAKTPGAVAAPTAGLHFTPALRDALLAAGHEFAYVTLHVGPGTFRPVKAATLDEHVMHRERYDLPAETAEAVRRAKAAGRPVLAVGTTVVRTLEAAALEATADEVVRAGQGDTALFIRPPYPFRVVDTLVTNFHLPRSTLLALVMAFAGEDTLRAAYAEAVRAQYRFFSYGDAMLLTRARS